MSEREVVGGLRLCGYRYGIFRKVPGRPVRVVWAGWTLRRAQARFHDVRARCQKPGARFLIRML
jgi:hypothetical protein